ncbi:MULTISPECIES: hypothetical protein [Methylosinus]|uniref:Uncharacterized protein n=1 Tax=Methylosinus trichosporium (strain ATCC 35070 / NCIMB 11131 / UNIQEM 75 / OB3b) TaxID=595536 RepID=A0A2D2D409_METT3|nr:MULTISPECIES: hypothetical protein [Methylosinus]ATQ69704.1 hypothetical protein CQW49_18805 [Methylosinus trichosporium OB3b]OBS51211.1 hypothetical protein A8B73_17290 [Methylosinus sp. 3S-1]
MTALRAAAALIGLACLIAPHAPRAQEDADQSDLPPYSAFRRSLLAEGWTPDANYGLKVASGKPLYRFPEVLCGPQICHARWLARGGGEKIVTLRRGGLSDEYRVAR